MSDATTLTERQREILSYIRETVRGRGYPPSVREIGEAVGLRSTSSVHSQLRALTEAGYLRRDPSRPRAMEVLPPPGEEGPAATADGLPVDAAGATVDERLREVPLVGEIAAGTPIVADEQAVDRYALPRDLVGEGTLFMLAVRGDSMVDDGILDGDLVVVRQQDTVDQGELCAALVDGEATVKRFRRAPSGEVFLDPANEAYAPIPVTAEQDAAVLGKVTAVLRSV